MTRPSQAENVESYLNAEPMPQCPVKSTTKSRWAITRPSRAEHAKNLFKCENHAAIRHKYHSVDGAPKLARKSSKVVVTDFTKFWRHHGRCALRCLHPFRTPTSDGCRLCSQPHRLRRCALVSVRRSLWIRFHTGTNRRWRRPHCCFRPGLLPFHTDGLPHSAPLRRPLPCAPQLLPRPTHNMEFSKSTVFPRFNSNANFTFVLITPVPAFFWRLLHTEISRFCVQLCLPLFQLSFFFTFRAVPSLWQRFLPHPTTKVAAYPFFAEN